MTYYTTHRDTILASRKVYYKNNRDKMVTYQRAYRAKNKIAGGLGRRGVRKAIKRIENIKVRVTTDEKSRIDEAARQHQMKVSKFIRLAVESYLDDKQPKHLF